MASHEVISPPLYRFKVTKMVTGPRDQITSYAPLVDLLAMAYAVGCGIHEKTVDGFNLSNGAALVKMPGKPIKGAPWALTIPKTYWIAWHTSRGLDHGLPHS